MRQRPKNQPLISSRNTLTGFTLAELLVSLAILGVIATFIIPKILISQQEAQKKAIFKETIATLYELTHKAKLDPGSNVANQSLQLQFYRSNLNYTKECSTDPVLQGCLAAGAPFSNAGNASAFVLSNGAVITSVNGVELPTRETLVIDWNGPVGPNLLGDDILSTTVCYGPGACNNASAPILFGPTGAGAVGPNTAGTNITLWTEIFE